MIYIGKLYAGFSGVISGTVYSIEKGKPFEAIEGDVPEEFGTPIHAEKRELAINNEIVETATLRKPGRRKK